MSPTYVAGDLCGRRLMWQETWWLQDGTTAASACMLIKYKLVCKFKCPPPICRRLPGGYRMGHLQPQHAALVNDMWEFGGDTLTEARIRYQIEHLPSICIYNEQDEPVSWNVLQITGFAGMGKMNRFNPFTSMGDFKQHITMNVSYSGVKEFI
jgi:hypothetical protein